MPAGFLKQYIKDLNDAMGQLDAAEFAHFMQSLSDALDREVQVFICGNGGSASTASHFGCDINKGVSHGKQKRFKVICLNDNIPTMLAYANDLHYDEVFVEQLKNFMNAGDLIIGISGSGNSENIIRAVRYGNENGAGTYGLCGCGGGRLRDAAHNAITVQSNDMQKIEDIHLIVVHAAMQYLMSQQS